MKITLSILLALLALPALGQAPAPRAYVFGVEEIKATSAALDDEWIFVYRATLLYCGPVYLTSAIDVRMAASDTLVELRGSLSDAVVAWAAASGCVLSPDRIAVDFTGTAAQSGVVWRQNLIFASSQSPTAIGATADCGILATNLGLSPVQVGQAVYADLSGVGRVRLNVRAANASNQTGTVTCRLRDVASATTLAQVDVTSTSACTSATIVSAISPLSGPRKLACQCASSSATDDPSFAYCGAELSP